MKFDMDENGFATQAFGFVSHRMRIYSLFLAGTAHLRWYENEK